ncbi:Os01g0824634 [Oryza sativa Japonica Group]|uniref:Os01g0824634 protein n=1 Tax=Oryza sativa subsp. japonica TaxID=39947 RepID=A0A0P0V9Q7_ORYSJ|nr:Os01g0824634 [Oryza sativa Japonica Group]
MDGDQRSAATHPSSSFGLAAARKATGKADWLQGLRRRGFVFPPRVPFWQVVLRRPKWKRWCRRPDPCSPRPDPVRSSDTIWSSGRGGRSCCWIRRQ